MQSPKYRTPSTPGRVAQSRRSSLSYLKDCTATPQTPMPRVPFSTPLTPPDSHKSRTTATIDLSGSAGPLNPLSAPIDLAQLSSAFDSPLSHRNTGSFDTSITSDVACKSHPFQRIYAGIDSPTAPIKVTQLPTVIEGVMQSSMQRAPSFDLTPTPSAPLARPAAASAPTPPVEDHRTPNVYINGLPPNFAEEALYGMTKVGA